LVTAQRNEYVAGFALLSAMGKAQARDLGLDGGALYDPASNYERVHHRIWDWDSDPAQRPRPPPRLTPRPRMRQSPTSHCPDPRASPLWGKARCPVFIVMRSGFQKMRQAGEPSVEDILASIKKVIARDSRGAGHEAARAPMSPAAAAAAIAPP
jgi:hypothetical protein